MPDGAPDLAPVLGPAYRLIPSRFPPIGAFDDVCDKVAAADDLAAVMELEGWTNDRLVAQRLARLPAAEWVFGRPNASVVMAAFLHGAPDGNRFSGPDLGAWYAGLSQKTAIAEVAHHLRRQTINEGRPSGQMTFRSYGARLDGAGYVDIRGGPGEVQGAAGGLYDRRSYARSQKFGEQQRAAGRDGILYDSLRHAGGVNVACYVPSKVLDVVQQDHFELRVFADPDRKAIAVRLSA